MKKGILAEAVVFGILRGGYLVGDIFVFHAGLMKIETKNYSDLKILDKKEIK